LRIGISTSVSGPEALSHPDLRTYVAAISGFGAEPVVFENDAARLGEQLAAVDGVVLAGGHDVDPARFGEDPHPSVRTVQAERDEFEIALLHEVRMRLVPTLGICRGLQVGNVAFGGSLIQDLPFHFGDQYVIHHAQTREDGMERTDYGIDHVVTVEPGSALARLLGTTEFRTNTIHHQAAKSIGRGLRAVAWTNDGVVEALDAEFEHPFFFLVQWHPEELADDPVSQRLFSGLAAAARAAAPIAR
jgi:putative glutamine amidotransferase